MVIGFRGLSIERILWGILMPKIKVVIFLTADEFQLLELAAKHYGNNVEPQVDRTASSQAGISQRAIGKNY